MTIEHLKKLEDSEFYKRLEKASIKKDSTVEAGDLFQLVKKFTKHAVELSRGIARDMPLYTDHQEQHFLNVLYWIEQLITHETLKHLSPLECALCILTAYLHDIGMCLPPEERKSLQTKGSDDYEKFERFKDGFVEERHLRSRYVQSKDSLEKNYADLIDAFFLAEYIRSTHAKDSDVCRKRLQHHLEALKKEANIRTLTYCDINFETHLMDILISHNQPANWLLEKSQQDAGDSRLEEKHVLHHFGEDTVNILLPALLLRLADIMDFDRTRTPRIYFRNLGLDTLPENQPGSSVTRLEWEKHMAISSKPTLKSLDHRRTLTYRANACPSPIIEKSIYEFKKLIQNEVDEVRSEWSHMDRMLENPDRHYEQNFPEEIKAIVEPQKSEIEGKPIYIYHDIEFKLDQEEIMRLLMGVNLYTDPSLCIRELLQNALDAVQLRKRRCEYYNKVDSADQSFVEPNDNYGKNETPEVTLSFGEENGEEYIRVEDNGTGMTKAQIECYFTRVGKSYYKSPEFIRERKAFRKKGIFTAPISQFGIGILSCFMLTSRIEVSTCPGHAARQSNQKRSSYDFTISGPGSLFWMRAGTRNKQGTIVTIYLKEKYQLASVEKELRLAHLRRKFGYKLRTGDQKLLKDNEDLLAFKKNDPQESSSYVVDPAFIAARHIIWPICPVHLRDDRVSEGDSTLFTIDDHFHWEALNPIDKDALRKATEKWGISTESIGDVRWHCWDWVDSEGDDASGSRIRLVFPNNKSLPRKDTNPSEELTLDPFEWSDTSDMKQGLHPWVLAYLLESNLIGLSRDHQVLAKGINVDDDQAVSKQIAVASHVGSYLWIDLKGNCLPELSSDRNKMWVTWDSQDAYSKSLEALVDKWIKESSSYTNSQGALCVFLTLLAAGTTQRSKILTQVSNELRACNRLWDSFPASWSFILKLFVEELVRDIERDKEQNQEGNRAWVRKRKQYPRRDQDDALVMTMQVYESLTGARAKISEPDLDQAKFLVKNLVIRRIENLAENLARILNQALERDPADRLERALERSLNQKETTGPDFIALDFLNEAFFPSLEQSWPPLQLFLYKGHIKQGFLKAPFLPDFKVEADGRTVVTHNSGIMDTTNNRIQACQFDFVLPLSAIPLGELRKILLTNKNYRALRSILMIPFLWMQGGLFKKHRWFLEDLMTGLSITSIYALAPVQELWLKPFTEWTEEDLQERCQSLLWDMHEDKLYCAQGTQLLAKIKEVGDTL